MFYTHDTHQRQKRKGNKVYDQTRSVFYIRQDATMKFLITQRFKTTSSNCKTIIKYQCTERKITY